MLIEIYKKITEIDSKINFITDELVEMKQVDNSADINNIETTTCVIDSRLRDMNRYSNSNKFEYSLPEPIYNIHSIELLSSKIPPIQYNIHSSGSYFFLKEDCSTTSNKVKISTGEYEVRDSLKIIKEKLNEVGTYGYDVILNKNNTITITVDYNEEECESDDDDNSDLPCFELSFEKSNLGNILGFRVSPILIIITIHLKICIT